MLAETDDLLADAVPIQVDITPLATASSSSNARKRKHLSGSGSGSAQGSPAPEPVPARQIAQGPLVPTFVPSAEGSPYGQLEHVILNHNGFRYTPACGGPAGAALAVRTGESEPRMFRASWEDRNPSIRVTSDGLGLAGADGFRSVRANVPIREGRWYLEVLVEDGGGARPPDSKRAQGAHVRLGWARREATLGGPAGMDGYAYAYRDATGERVTLSRPKPYGVPYGSGDIIGLYISLPPLRGPDPNDPTDPAHLHRERIAIQLGRYTYFESKEYPVAKEMRELADKGELVAPEPAPLAPKAKGGGPRARSAKATKPPPGPRTLPTLAGSRIAFFVNGVCQGTAFRDLLDFRPLRAGPAGTGGRRRDKRREHLQAHRDNPFDDGTLGYYALVSLFTGARVRLNAGPEFRFPPPPDVDGLLDALDAGEAVPEALHNGPRKWRPACERYEEYVGEQAALDEVDEEEAQVVVAQAAKDAAQEEKAEAARASRRGQANGRKKAKTAVTVDAVVGEEVEYAPSPLRRGGSPARTESSGADVDVDVDVDDIGRLVSEELADVRGAPVDDEFSEILPL
jgi:COMPASS component BRE2